MDREDSERNAMWARLREEHRRAPFALLLHGGDQIYADEITEGHPLSQDWPKRIPADPSRAASDGGGSGLGLTIARAIAEDHAGSLTAQSRGVGHGSCFTWTLPMNTTS